MIRSMSLEDALKLPVHPAAAEFPLLPRVNVSPHATEEQASAMTLDHLAADIAEHGIINPLVTYQGTLLDGRNRLAAAEMAGAALIPIEEYDGDSPVAYVLSANVARRELDPSARAVLAVAFESHFAAEAEARMLAGVADPGSIVAARVGRAPRAIEQAALALGVSSGLVQHAKTLAGDESAADLWAKVKAGDMAVGTAYAQRAESFVNPDGQRIARPTARSGKTITVGEGRDGDSIAVLVSSELGVTELGVRMLNAAADFADEYRKNPVEQAGPYLRKALEILTRLEAAV